MLLLHAAAVQVSEFKMKAQDILTDKHLQEMQEAGFFGGGGSYDRNWSLNRRDRADDWDEGNTEPPNNMAIYINGKKWKVFPGRGTYADDEREMKQLRDLQAWCRKKSEATGKKWEVSRTGEAPTP